MHATRASRTSFVGMLPCERMSSERFIGVLMSRDSGRR